MPEVVLEHQPAIDNSQGAPASSDFQSTADINISDYRHQRESESDAVSNEQLETESGNKGKGGVQRKIDKLTREKNALERRLQEVESRRAPLEVQRSQSQPEPAQPSQQRKYETLEQMAARLSRETGQQPETQNASPDPHEQQRQHQEFRQQHSAKFQSFHQRIDAAMQTDREFVEARKASAAAGDPVPAIIHVAMVEQPNGHEVAIYLAKNPWMRQRITSLWRASGDAVWQATGNPSAAENAANVSAIREIHRIATALEFGTALPAARPRIERPVSQAPTPPSPVGGGRSIAAKNPDEMTPKEYRNWRENGGGGGRHW